MVLMPSRLILLSALTFLSFAFLSLTVSFGLWERIDFQTTINLQNLIPRFFDQLFSYFSFLGRAETTGFLSLVLALLAIWCRRLLALFGWLMIFPATLIEFLGKIFIFHPNPPVNFLRTVTPTKFPSFQIETEFSYPSGHVTRITFLITIFVILALILIKGKLLKGLLVLFLLLLGFLMILSRIYLGEHWLSDVLGGVLLGLSFGFLAACLIIGPNMLRFRKK